MSINPSEALGIYLNSSAKIYKLLNFKITRETEESHSLPSSKGDLAYWGLRMMVYLHMINDFKEVTLCNHNWCETFASTNSGAIILVLHDFVIAKN